RYRYPFINCTQCGPRYTLIEKLPYDRPNTSMKTFPLCDPCNQQYRNPQDRRFHAQPLACADCGPVLSYRAQAQNISGNEPALTAAIAALTEGKILAVKGIGGYHLICDAKNTQAVQTLRDRKNRPDKPFAVLFPWQGTDGLKNVLQYLRPDASEAKQLRHPARPIVLIKQHADSTLASNISPGLNEVGALLPYSPLHFLLSQDFDSPLVATSANFSGEPVITDNDEAQQRLSKIADAFVHHNRPILRPADDSVVRIINHRPHYLRLGRGIAPTELTLPFSLNQPVLAVGGHMKNNIALAWNNRVVISSHVGDLSSVRSMKIFEQVIADLKQLYAIEPQHIVCDAHPDYASHRWAKEYAGNHHKNCVEVFHHHAHASTLCGEYPQPQRWLNFTWDGTGYGHDGQIWGGEALLGNAGQWQRVASFKPLRIVGGDKASLQPWRSAMALCWSEDYNWQPDGINVELAHQAWQKNLGCYQTSAVGRLFDAAASFIMQKHTCSFDGQAPMQLEQIASELTADHAIDLPINNDSQNFFQTDSSTLIKLLADNKQSAEKRSNIFHASMAMNLVNQAELVRQQHGKFVIGLSGGVFQNRKLTEFVIHQLKSKNFDVYSSNQIPCNDAGISYGQIIEAYNYINQD
ncbi:MAG: carbamoyltransferase HypF, partial [Gammaproteobacteria bacterium]|nr:carbamoyltransferase HypF [Gammaproteobacteria bacterium]